MIRTEIQAGICGFQTTVRAKSDDSQNVSLGIVSTCDKITALAGALGPIDAYQEIGDGFDGVVLTAARNHLKGCCAGYIVPSGSVALPAPLSITIERTE
jgi:hypothetical protein